MTDPELDDACTVVLYKLRDLNRRVSEQLTRLTNGHAYRNLPKQARKIEKVKLLYRNHPILFESIFAPLNAEWHRERDPPSPTNFFDMLDRRASRLNPYAVRTGGNFTTKV